MTKFYKIKKPLNRKELICLLDLADVTFSEMIVNGMPNKKKFEEVKYELTK